MMPLSFRDFEMKPAGIHPASVRIFEKKHRISCEALGL